MRIEQLRRVDVYGERPGRTFREAALKYVQEAVKDSIRQDIMHLKALDRFLGHMALEQIHMGSLQPFISSRRAEGVKSRTINYAVQCVRRILNLASSDWIDENGMTWLQSAPRIKLLPETDRREPYPLDFDEQERLFRELPGHLRKMALFKVNTGCRENEVCSLKWKWEVPFPELGTSVFIIPGRENGEGVTKNRDSRVVVLNTIARSIVEGMRGIHPVHVFSYKGKGMAKMNDSAWKKARVRAGLPCVRVHDLRHTFARRLRAVGVSFEDRQDLLGHRSSRVTTHYSAPEIGNLISAVEKICVGVCEDISRKTHAMTLLKLRAS